MKIMFLVSSDSGNYPLLNLVREFGFRGNEISVFGLYHNYNHIKVFVDNGIEVMDIEYLEYKDLYHTDILVVAENFSTTHKINKLILDTEVFIVSLAMLFENDYIYPYSDFIFTIGENKINTLEQLGYKIPFMATGTPQYEEDETKNLDDPIFLYIDQGLYPVGIVGKKELAKMLIEIAQKNPNHKVIIKPRYLPNEKENQVHICHEHIYDYINEYDIVPQNLILLEDNVPLRHLIKKAICVITPNSTAYIEAALMNKRIILLEGLPSEECPDIRESRIERSYSKLRETGCVINYKEILKYLPNGLEINNSYLEKEVYDLNKDATRKIVDVCEYIYKKVIITKKRLLVKRYEYSNYEKTIVRGISECITERKLSKVANEYIQKAINRKYQLDVRDYREDIKDIWDIRNENLEINQLTIELNKAADKYLERYIDISRPKRYANKFVQMFTFIYLFHLGKYYKIINFPKDKVVCEKSFAFFGGKSYFILGDYKKSIEFLKRYIELVQNDCILHYKDNMDKEEYRLSSYYYIGVSYFQMKNYIDAVIYFEKCIEMTNNKHFKALEYVNICRMSILD